jgi:hypothetical protein
MKGISIAQIPQLLYVCMIIVAFVGAAYIMAESFQGTTYVATTVTNESKTLNNYTLATFTVSSYVTSITRVGNTTLTLGAGNYSLQQNTAYHVYQLLPKFSTGILNGTFNVSYIYNAESKSSAAIGYVIAFIDAIITNLPAVGIVIFIVLLVGAVMWIRSTQKTQGGA